MKYWVQNNLREAHILSIIFFGTNHARGFLWHPLPLHPSLYPFVQTQVIVLEPSLFWTAAVDWREKLLLVRMLNTMFAARINGSVNIFDETSS